MTYLYHYHAMSVLQANAIQHYDGTVTRDQMIVSGKDFSEVRESIAREANCPTEKITICSLTLLNPH